MNGARDPLGWNNLLAYSHLCQASNCATRTTALLKILKRNWGAMPTANIRSMKLWEAANAQRSTPNAQRPSQGEMKIRGENSDSLKRDQANQGIPSEFLRLEVGM